MTYDDLDNQSIDSLVARRVFCYPLPPEMTNIQAERRDKQDGGYRSCFRVSCEHWVSDIDWGVVLVQNLENDPVVWRPKLFPSSSLEDAEFLINHMRDKGWLYSTRDYICKDTGLFKVEYMFRGPCSSSITKYHSYSSLLSEDSCRSICIAALKACESD